MNSEAILVVDDDLGALTCCSSILQESGYTVLSASSGEEALEISYRERGKIDLALVDVVMPNMTGVELVRRLEAATCTPRIALISGYSPEEVSNLIGHDASSYRIFWKPFDIPIFLQMIRNVLDSPQREIASYARP